MAARFSAYDAMFQILSAGRTLCPPNARSSRQTALARFQKSAASPLSDLRRWNNASSNRLPDEDLKQVGYVGFRCYIFASDH
jgi:hypothetical protein